MLILYRRHFLLLAAFGVCIAAAGVAHVPSDISISFALYGALHAIALVLAVRRPDRLWRKCVFVVIAAVLSVMAVRVGGFAGRRIATAGAGLYLVFAAASLAGAAAYGIVTTLFDYARLTARTLAAIAAACVSATAIALFVLIHLRFLGPWWLALAWWYAFSGGLWYVDQASRPASAISA